MPLSPALWVVFCAYCNVAGWLLSALHQLNLAGYALAFLPGAAGLFWMRRRICPMRACGHERTVNPDQSGHPPGVAQVSNPRSSDGSELALRVLRKFKRRFRQPFPLAFLVLALLAIVGGALYAPTNFD